ncbi:hypothetical protein [Flavobacterium sp.]|uniref:hypothetical protein n=1 Tax=Flavobacterium sp. TaxID=239 RepID=UPI002634F6BA|nr:hypothetical protein [Flavobacterium sp.]
MAKTSGVIKIEGTVEDLTFYKKDGKNFVRKKGGISKERISSDPNFVRTRENNNEFSHSGSSGKILKLALGSLVFKAKDSKLSSRLLQLMSRIKNLDTVSTRGNRQVSVGTAEGKQLLKGFDFNANAPLKSVFFVNYDLDTATGVTTVTDFIPLEQLMYPQGSTHISLQSAVVHLDFATQESEIALSNLVNLPLNLTMSTSVLTPSGVPTGTGIQLFLLFISFYQEVNGVQYSLKNEEYNVLNVVEVI